MLNAEDLGNREEWSKEVLLNLSICFNLSVIRVLRKEGDQSKQELTVLTSCGVKSGTYLGHFSMKTMQKNMDSTLEKSLM